MCLTARHDYKFSVLHCSFYCERNALSWNAEILKKKIYLNFSLHISFFLFKKDPTHMDADLEVVQWVFDPARRDSEGPCWFSFEPVNAEMSHVGRQVNAVNQVVWLKPSRAPDLEDRPLLTSHELIHKNCVLLLWSVSLWQHLQSRARLRPANSSSLASSGCSMSSTRTHVCVRLLLYN